MCQQNPAWQEMSKRKRKRGAQKHGTASVGIDNTKARERRTQTRNARLVPTVTVVRARTNSAKRRADRNHNPRRPETATKKRRRRTVRGCKQLGFPSHARESKLRPAPHRPFSLAARHRFFLAASKRNGVVFRSPPEAAAILAGSAKKAPRRRRLQILPVFRVVFRRNRMLLTNCEGIAMIITGP